MAHTPENRRWNRRSGLRLARNGFVSSPDSVGGKSTKFEWTRWLYWHCQTCGAIVRLERDHIKVITRGVTLVKTCPCCKARGTIEAPAHLSPAA